MFDIYAFQSAVVGFEENTPWIEAAFPFGMLDLVRRTLVTAGRSPSEKQKNLFRKTLNCLLYQLLRAPIGGRAHEAMWIQRLGVMHDLQGVNEGNSLLTADGLIPNIASV